MRISLRKPKEEEKKNGESRKFHFISSLAFGRDSKLHIM